MMEIIMWVGIGDNGMFPYWPSLSTNKLDCKRKIYDWLYAPLNDKPNWSEWKFRQVRINRVKLCPVCGKIHDACKDCNRIITTPPDTEEKDFGTVSNNEMRAFNARRRGGEPK